MKKQDSANNKSKENSNFVNDFSSHSNDKYQHQKQKQLRHTTLCHCAFIVLSTLSFPVGHHTDRSVIYNIINDDIDEYDDDNHENGNAKDHEHLCSTTARAAFDVNVQIGSVSTSSLHVSQSPEYF